MQAVKTEQEHDRDSAGSALLTIAGLTAKSQVKASGNEVSSHDVLPGFWLSLSQA